MSTSKLLSAVGHSAADALGAIDETVILVSEDVTHDRRVLASMAGYVRPRVILVTGEALATGCERWRAIVAAARVLVDGFACLLRLRSLLRQRWDLRFSHLATGLAVSWRSFVRAQRVAHRLHTTLSSVRVIHAHDLLCGIVGAHLATCFGAKLVYDAHEVEFHRNRRNSLLRTAFDVRAERVVIEAASEVRVVNRPIADLYRSLYEIPEERIRVVPNDHFVCHYPSAALAEIAPGCCAIVYVGAGTRGRQLDLLARAAGSCKVRVYAFFVGEVPEIAVHAGWEIGPCEYERPLLALTARYRCAMWCCVDDVCLSYRLALPNKFFQALAVGMPVIAASGTYLAELVNAHRLGFVFDGNNFQEIVQELRAPSFTHIVHQICSFHQDLASGRESV